MNMTDVVALHPSEAERLLSWLKCHQVIGQEIERKSLEAVLEQAISLAKRPHEYRLLDMAGL